jgi:hypothetical protein
MTTAPSIDDDDTNSQDTGANKDITRIVVSGIVSCIDLLDFNSSGGIWMVVMILSMDINVDF